MSRNIKSLCLAVAICLNSLVATAEMVPQMNSNAASGTCQLPELLIAWEGPAQSVPSVSTRQASDAANRTEQPVRVALQSCAADWCKPGSWVAMIKFDIPATGRYRVAVDQMLWIDLHTASQKLEGVLCEHSGCQPIRKIVQFDVQSGAHWVVLEGRAVADVGVLMSRVKP